jgi:REP element-mobilizing transposase RayT
MGQPRCKQISLEATPYYHLVSRCVRRQFLCGQDALTGQDYSHRREWITSRLAYLVDVFAIDLCAYAVLSNHYHLVVRVNEANARSLTPREVIQRWLRVFRGPAWMHEFIDAGESATLHPAMRFRVEAYRSRLMSIPWLMRCLNEPIARRANHEDGVTGHFWQGRYRSQALADEGALLAAMAYVDLNPLRAGIVDRPEAGRDCSATQRFRGVAAGADRCAEPSIVAFAGAEDETCGQRLPGERLEYLELLDWTGRQVAKPGGAVISAGIPPIAERLGLAARGLVAFVSGRQRYRQSVLGNAAGLAGMARQLGRRYVRGYRNAAGLFRGPPDGFSGSAG